MSKSFETKKIFLTPAMAADFIAKGVKNRVIKARRLALYVADMKEGRWEYTHQGIAVDEYGILSDGHHRCLAVIKSGCTIETNVSCGVPRDVFSKFDAVGARTPNDALFLSEDLPPRVSKVISSAIPLCVAYEEGKAILKSYQIGINPVATTLDYFAKNKKIKTSAEYVGKMPYRDSLISNSIACFIHYQIIKIGGDADHFLSRLLVGDGVVANSIMGALRQSLIANKIGNHRIIDAVLINRIIGTYKAELRGFNSKDPRQWINSITSTSENQRFQ